MIDYAALHDIFGDELPEPHLFFATRSNKYATSYTVLRRELGLPKARSNLGLWLAFKERYALETGFLEENSESE